MLQSYYKLNLFKVFQGDLVFHIEEIGISGLYLFHKSCVFQTSRLFVKRPSLGNVIDRCFSSILRPR